MTFPLHLLAYLVQFFFLRRHTKKGNYNVHWEPQCTLLIFFLLLAFNVSVFFRFMVFLCFFFLCFVLFVFLFQFCFSCFFVFYGFSRFFSCFVFFF